MIILRMARGISDHAAARIMEWFMLAPAFGMSVAFAVSPTMFSTSPSFTTLSRWASETTWGTIVLACAVARLAALIINGTFKGFRLSPHIRFAAALVGILFWSQWTLCFIQSFLAYNGAASPIVAYGSFCLAELINLYRSGSDVGHDLGAKDGRR